jgi:hypothetical protein
MASPSDLTPLGAVRELLERSPEGNPFWRNRLLMIEKALLEASPPRKDARYGEMDAYSALQVAKAAQMCIDAVKHHWPPRDTYPKRSRKDLFRAMHGVKKSRLRRHIRKRRARSGEGSPPSQPRRLRAQKALFPSRGVERR